jgi:putative hydrolase of the HAD superfamily
MSYRAVLFDLFGTLLYVEYTGTRETAVQTLVAAGVPEADWLRGWRATFEPGARGELRTMRHRVLAALAIAGVAQADDALVDQVCGLLIGRWYPQLYRDVRPTLEELRRRGFQTGLISNMRADEQPAFAVFDLDPLFDVITLSHEVGLAKPDPAIYRLAAERLSLDPTECVFVDDIGTYLAGARAVGMATVFIDRAENEFGDKAAGSYHPAAGTYDLRVEHLGELVGWLPACVGERKEVGR